MKDNKKVISAIDVSQYLLSLDLERKFFTSHKMSSREDWGTNPPVEGNFRLNKLLHILQILYYVKYGDFLFSEDMIAQKHGPVVSIVMKSFSNQLVKLKNYPRINNVYSEQKEFISDKFNHFRDYTNHELRELSHDDPSWQLAWEKGFEATLSKDSNILEYWKDFYQHVLEEIEEE